MGPNHPSQTASNRFSGRPFANLALKRVACSPRFSVAGRIDSIGIDFSPIATADGIPDQKIEADFGFLEADFVLEIAQ